ncbi:phosphatidylinositol-4-phosphate 5-kinase [Achlya hypogyna]|uniref:Phosphatidylinositol-4-phosphate 5-kinase n=1 Tax=Achlya hypogyna TaxID=1202772 RepID=A0A1V9YQN7_ACHHY|nr:phosphatidylinositol-4-phosphate 5-kinase [Achlya hypogyna]
MPRAKTGRRNTLAKELTPMEPAASPLRPALDRASQAMQALILDNKGRPKQCHLLVSTTETKPGVFKLAYADASSYRGQALRGSMRHGKGVFTAHDGDILEGNWKDDRFHGFGTRIFALTGDRHEGMYYKDKRHGRGTYLWANGDKYIGEFYNGRMHGPGVLIAANGDTFKGHWTKGVVATGTQTTILGDELHGATPGGWLDGRFTGHGRKRFRNGDLYIGSFVTNMAAGLGTFTWANGDVYEGEMAANRMHGRGCAKYRDGAYVGAFARGVYHGFGRRTYASGAVYDGAFEHGARHGVGIYTWVDGEVYQGEWVHDRPHGMGVWATADRLFHGAWRRGVPHGPGCYIDNETQEASYYVFDAGLSSDGRLRIEELLLDA